MASNRSKCRSCGAYIEWLTTPNGKKMPVNVEEIPIIPSEVGKVLAVTPDGKFIRGYTCSESYEKERWIYARLSHFVSCPNANTHRKRGVR